MILTGQDRRMMTKHWWYDTDRSMPMYDNTALVYDTGPSRPMYNSTGGMILTGPDRCMITEHWCMILTGQDRSTRTNLILHCPAQILHWLFWD
jgi:hypothetical protein